ncbi:hypothetical protein V8E36_000265 [Tilletia maclaganii]
MLISVHSGLNSASSCALCLQLPPELRHAATTGTIAAPVEVHKFTYGESNPTCTLTDKNSARYVLRKKPSGALRFSHPPRTQSREYRILQAVGKYNDALSSPGWTPCPCRIFSDGRMLSMPTHAALAAAWDSAIRTLADLHRIDPVQAEAQDKDSGKRVGPIPEFGKLVKWFSQNLPADKNRIVHGDYKIDNLSIDLPHHRAIRHRVIDVLDWELSTLGLIPLDSIAELRRRLYDPEERVNAVSAGLSLMMGGLKGVEEKVRREGGQPCEQAGRQYLIPVWTYCQARAWLRVGFYPKCPHPQVSRWLAVIALGQAQLYASRSPSPSIQPTQPKRIRLTKRSTLPQPTQDDRKSETSAVDPACYLMQKLEYH